MKATQIRLWIGLATVGIIVGAGEWVARYRLGLGTPPLYVADTLTEYRLKPNQNLRRFGNRIEVNTYSMRSAPLSPIRPADTRRILIFGDSVVWGGSVLDQSLIASEVLRREAPTGIRGSATPYRRLEVGNVAAPSWGPGNWLGWAKRFGVLQATDVVLVIGSGDAADNPSPEPFKGDLNHPLQAPTSALAEGFERYLLPRLGFRRLAASPQTPITSKAGEPTTPADPRVVRGLADLRAFIHLARSSGARVVVLQFADRQEAATGNFQPGNAWIAQVLHQEGVPSVQAGPIFRSCGPIGSLYTDGIHPYTAAGQACLAKAIAKTLATH